ncbi:monocarboxylate transporter 3-like isoform X1 [Amblyomma americanum]
MPSSHWRRQTGSEFVKSSRGGSMAITAARLKENRRFGVDSRWSWVTAGLLSWVMFMGTISQQSMGVLFYGIIHDFGASREQAAWPLVFSAACTSLAGPATAYFCQRFSCRAVLWASSIAGALSLCACSLTDNILLLTFFFGFIQGMALSGLYVACNVLVSQYFERYRVTACSLLFFLYGLNMLLAPPLVELFRSTYGIRGTFLLLCGLSLNTCPAVIAIRSPKWMKSIGRFSGDDNTGTFCEMAAVRSGNVPLEDGTLVKIAHEKQESTSQDIKLAPSAAPPLVKSNIRRPKPVNLLFTLWSKREREKGGSQGSPVLMARKLLSIQFAIHALTFTVLMFGMAGFLLLSVDIAKDRGVPPPIAVFLTTSFAVGDVILRPLSGLIIDADFLSIEAVMFLGFLLQAVAFELFVWFTNLPIMLACSVLIGISNGCRAPLQAPALVKDFGIDALPLVMGAATFCNGLALLTRPPLVGYCRDVLGSYDFFLHLVAIANVAVCGAWAMKYFSQSRQGK